MTAAGPQIAQVADRLGWGEGPALFPAAGGIVFSDIPNDVMYVYRKGGVSEFRRPSNRANGNAVDCAGRLITCEHKTRRVIRTNPDGSVMVIADRYAGLPLNSPNDVFAGPDDALWFTDPPYGVLNGDAEGGGAMLPSAVYRHQQHADEIEQMIDVLDKPNGIALSPDGRFLYVSDTGYSESPLGSHHIFRFELIDRRPRNMIVFKEIFPGACDGLRIDALGNVWATAGDGVHCYSADGQEVCRISLGEMTTNLCFLPESLGFGLFVTTPSRALCCTLAPAPEGFCRNPAGFEN